MKAFLIYSGQNHGTSGVAAVVFAENETDAFHEFAVVLNDGENADVYQAVGRRIVARGERMHPDREMRTTETYNQAFEVEEVNVEAGNVILASDYYGPSLSHHRKEAPP